MAVPHAIREASRGCGKMGITGILIGSDREVGSAECKVKGEGLT
jgi:hypothetical protein